ncbi:MAG: hyaluronidase [Bacteroidetes bacterium]|nr:hyaluronidase [Bacteroidota bacterium]
MAMENLPPAVKAFQKKQNIKSIPILYASDFDPEDDGVADEVMLHNAIHRKIPDSNYQGIAVIDWEDPGFPLLEKGDVQSTAFQQTIAKYLRVLQLCKQARPKASWGYYGIPFTSYWDSATVLNINKRIDPLINAVDVLLPSLYNYYPDNTPQTNNKAYYTANAMAMAAMAKENQKQCYIFIWHRYHPSNQDVGLQLLPKTVFARHIQWMKTAASPLSFDGFIWWGADDYYFKTGSVAIQKEAGTIPFDKHWSNTIISYGQMIKKQLN